MTLLLVFRSRLEEANICSCLISESRTMFRSVAAFLLVIIAGQEHVWNLRHLQRYLQFGLR